MKKVLKNTLALLSKTEKQYFYLLSLMDAVISILDIASLALLLVIINFYSQPSTVIHSPLLASWLTDQHSVLPVAVFLFFFTVKNLFAYLLQKTQYKFVYKAAARLSEKKFLQYLEGSYAGYSGIDSSVYIRKISHHPVEFAQYVLSGIQQIITQTVLIITALAAVCWFNPTLFGLLFVLLLPPVLAIAFFIRKRTRTARASIKTTGEKTLQYLKEGLSGYVESNIYDKHVFFTERYAGWQKQLNDHLSKLQGIQGLSGRLLEIFAVLGLFVLIAVSKWAGNESSFNILSIGAFMAAAYKIMPGVVKILNSSGQIRTYTFAVTELLQDDAVKNTAVDSDAVNIGSVEFKNVSFAYNEKQLLSNFSWSVQRGDFIGISGISGNGKTTMLNLLLAFLQQDSGDILINGSVSSQAARQRYRKQVSYVKQQPFLIHDSLLKNIVLDEKAIDPGKLEAAIAAAGLQELADADESGLDQLITEAGKNISGGQRQRIAIARALYKNADLFILDEPFNELDKASELALLQQFASLAAAGKMILLITHNKESFSFCNKIISLDEK